MRLYRRTIPISLIFKPKKYMLSFFKQARNRYIALSSFLISIPNLAIADFRIPNDYSYEFTNEIIIQNLLKEAKFGNIESLAFELNQITEKLCSSNDPLSDSCSFLQALTRAIHTQYSISVPLSNMLQLTRETVQKFQIPESELAKYFVGLDLIEYHLAEADCSGSVSLVKHHKEKHNFWTWLSLATITAAAVTVCIVVPQATTAIIGGAVEVGKAALGK